MKALKISYSFNKSKNIKRIYLTIHNKNKLPHTKRGKIITTKLLHISKEITQKANSIAIDLIEKLDMIGLLAVEFFLCKNGDLLVNEIAPRPHNSGHHTIECCNTSQYAQHLRSILNLPLGDTTLINPGAMINILGEKGFIGPAIYEGLEKILGFSGVYPHIYGKSDTKPFRKMGHVTITGSTLLEVKRIADQVKETIKVKA